MAEAEANKVKIEYQTSISEHFKDLPDPRKPGMILHKLLDIITIAVCGIICGANDWVGVETFGKSKQQWLSGFLELPNGIPSHDTFNNVLNSLSATKLQECFAAWMQSLVQLLDGEIVAIDGKCLRHSYDRKSGKAAIHMVSAWANSNRVVLGQVKADEKSNEITAIPELLKLLDIKGCIVTIDAAGCQKTIARDIIVREADYVLALKGNQGTLHEDVKDYFEWALAKNFKSIVHSYHETIDGGHGRIETRRYWTIDDIEWLDNREKWAGLTSIGMVESHREIGDKVTTERRFYITSLSSDAQRFGRAVRAHWGIENSLHWSLDVTFNEDYSRIRKDNGPENFAVLRHIALSLLKQDSSHKTGIANKRLKAALDQDYLYKILTMQ
ncbi:ISAs1 family transposase [Candidatus Venteria ishoeyi]|uniref:ISAs1 family transposase n=1 Tax=Candidatus Venteria ishoeyi TaxID=1899563 RepID=UPI0025A5BB0C|nr:ISAs1 family transposase [Candidatus Venteria ishoeyi]MDM8546741.1 ISAs1 family transposase [Candidatus Venteria ishoeyi]